MDTNFTDATICARHMSQYFMRMTSFVDFLVQHYIALVTHSMNIYIDPFVTKLYVCHILVKTL